MAKRRYTQEFKLEALNLAKDRGSFLAAARELGVTDSLLHSWAKKFKFSLKSNKVENAVQVEQSEEIRRLKKENEELRKVNNILKKAAAFFSQDHL